MAEEKKQEKEEESVPVQANFNPARKKPVFSWQSPEFVKYQKNSNWYVSVFGIALILAGIFFWQKQWTGMAVVIVAAVVLTISSETKPKQVKCAVYAEGVVVDEKIFTYNQFKHFWLSVSDVPKMRLQLIGRFASQVTLPMLGQDTEQIRMFLGKHLPETQQRDDVSDSINTLLQF